MLGRGEDFDIWFSRMYTHCIYNSPLTEALVRAEALGNVPGEDEQGRFVMKTVVQKWGNSLALRIPKMMAEYIKVKEGASVEITENKGSLMIASASVKPSLKELLSKIKPENLHGEIETGLPVGKEVW